MAWSVELELVIPRPLARFAGAALLLLSVVPELGSETVSLATYYPAPSGAYSNFSTTGQTILARTAGQRVRIGSTSTAPDATLAVTGAVTAYAPEGTHAYNRVSTCTPLTPAGNGVTNCGAAGYATFTQGVYSERQATPERTRPGVGATNSAVTFWCCSFPPSGQATWP